MRRRAYLAIAGISVAALSGCANRGGGGGSDDESASPDTTEGGQVDPPPVTSWSFTDLPEQDAVRIAHDGGDTVTAATITLSVDDERRGTLAEVFGVENLRTGDSETVDVPSDTTGTVELIWRPPDVDQVQVIATHSYDVR